jgi:conserved oligomeric Golgi complex subunit 7
MSISSEKAALASAPPSASLIATGSLEERLQTILSAPQFTVASYLNVALEEETEESLSQRMAELALSLQWQTSACHEDIGKLGAELQALLPRCAADVGRLGVGLEGLSHDAESLWQQTQVESTHEEVSSSLETLSTLHALQANLSKARDVLHAAATWDTTLTSVAPLMAQQQWAPAVAALVHLKNGERALRGMPNPEQRREALQKLQQQVLTLLHPQLTHALATMHTRLAPLQQCVSLYTQLEQLDILQQEYRKQRPAALHKLWFDYNPSHSFWEWLPTWLDAVLSFLAEERRHVTAVFGPNHVPDLMLQVLRECFRPILPSFKSRLESTCSSTTAGPALPTLAVLYEATLRFLSLAYESMVGGWMDLHEAGTLTIPLAPLWPAIQSLFGYIMAPFASYQKNSTLLEQDYLQLQRPALGITGTSSSTASSTAGTTEMSSADDWSLLIPVWTEASSKLLEDVLPPSLDRLSLLHGGYYVTQTLPMLDRCVTTQLQDMTLALQPLLSQVNNSTTTTTTSTVGTLTLDDAQVTAALEFCKVVGIWQQDMHQWEERVRARLHDWYERRQVYEQTRMDSLPDAWTPLDINAHILHTVCFETHQQDGDELLVANVATLQRWTTAVVLFPESMDALRRFSTACKSLVFHVCSAVPFQALRSMSSLGIWNETGSASHAEFSYGTLPQTYITQVGEHMLALVQALEPFASNRDNLTVVHRVMHQVRSIAVAPWNDFAAAAGFAASDTILASIMDAKEMYNYVAVVPLDEDEDEEEDEESKAVTEFCNQWLDVVGLAVTGRLLERIMRIPSLSSKGCEHLQTDLSYLVNVLSALGVSGHPHPLLAHFAEMVTLDDELLHERIMARDRHDPVAVALRSAEERLVAIRSASTPFK